MPHPGNERRQLPPQKQPEEERSRPAVANPLSRPSGSPGFGGGFRCALNAPPYGHRRAPLQPPPNSRGNTSIKQSSGSLLRRRGGKLLLRPSHVFVTELANEPRRLLHWQPTPGRKGQRRPRAISLRDAKLKCPAVGGSPPLLCVSGVRQQAASSRLPLPPRGFVQSGC